MYLQNHFLTKDGDVCIKLSLAFFIPILNNEVLFMNKLFSSFVTIGKSICIKESSVS